MKLSHWHHFTQCKTVIGGSDYSVVTGAASQKTLNSTSQQTTYAVTIISDGIVLEEVETFNLRLQQTSGEQPVIAFQNTTITIVDGDGQTNTLLLLSYMLTAMPHLFARADWCCLL